MTTISIRLEDEDKKELEAMCAEMGMNITTFYMIYTKKALRDRRIPFEIAAPDPFYSKRNLTQLHKAVNQVREGQTVAKTMEELEALEDE
ncbi:MAG: type II toxin-antitoxin system RelB/DinJ family antitoxin [Lachnospiraceae bacterium]|nr:type II toxin-antitoxin system RelB/DinJ family antitoxin [Lachnospiraceae bacterium]